MTCYKRIKNYSISNYSYPLSWRLRTEVKIGGMVVNVKSGKNQLQVGNALDNSA